VAIAADRFPRVLFSASKRVFNLSLPLPSMLNDRIVSGLIGLHKLVVINGCSTCLRKRNDH